MAEGDNELTDVRLRNGDFDLYAGRDFIAVRDQEAFNLFIQTILMGLDHTFNIRLKSILNSQSVRKLSPERTAQLLKEEIEDRIKNVSYIYGKLIEVKPIINKENNRAHIALRYTDGKNYSTEIKFIGTIYDDTYDFRFSEVIS